MPELPEVDAVVRRFNQAAQNATIHSVKIERPGIVAPHLPAQFKALHNTTILAARRRAKHIFLDLSNGLTLHIHLRMTGNLYVLPDYRFRPHTARLWFRLTDNRVIIFEDQRAFGRIHIVTPADIEDIESKLGPEPLEPAFTPSILKQSLATTKSPIKPALLDQARIAGIGNIYASEALWHAKIPPATPANQLPANKLKPLHAAIRKVLQHAVTSAYAAYTNPGDPIESESFGVAVYDREGEPCLRCHTPIARMVQAQRSTYFCPHCQPC